ncbi:hypothetical protein [Siphonobacter sp. SORGH_AS_0500]|uniref:hypothetical protein n=1 Tax=Siphonobacter sp. SORGH_AS_0500 TaxID=1864824 RepID=UPI00286764B0|nr:hypothetical protein [Siphonobacter sp. SORGH_AS_0500]MDR6196185.1 hypothetical protein [Siphonobacter sp. SORGH_AS_0500]
MRLLFTAVLLLTLSITGFSQTDSTQKSGLRKWIDRRNERLNQAAESDRLEFENNKRKKQERFQERTGVNMQKDIDRRRESTITIQRAGYALKSGGGLMLGGLLIGLGGSAVSTIMASNGNTNTTTITAATAVVGTLLAIIGGAELIKAGNILTDYEPEKEN